MRQFVQTLVIGACSTLVLSGSVFGQEEVSLDDLVVYGFDDATKNLVRQRLADGSFEAVGQIHLAGGTVITELGSLAYVPGRLHLYGVWNYLGDEASKLVKINIFTGEATPCAADTGFGNIQGLAASWHHGHEIEGQVNINPNNSHDSEFVLTLADGTEITQDDLNKQYLGYAGSATSVHFKPKGNGNQNGLIVNEEIFALENANTYDITDAEMTVNLYNDQIVNGKSMGHWWIEITANAAAMTSSGDDGPTGDGHWILFATQTDPVNGSGLIRINPANGNGRQVMPLSQAYEGLAQHGEDNGEFYATVGSSVYLIDVEAGTETPVGAGDYADIDAMGFALGLAPGTEFEGVDPVFTEEGVLFGFSGIDHTLVLVNPGTGETLALPYAINSADLGGMVVMLDDFDPQISLVRAAFD